MNNKIKQIIIFCIFITFFACGGNSAPTASIPMDSPGSGISALKIADQVSYVTAQETLASGSINASVNKFMTKFAAPTTGDYATDETEYYVYEESMSALDIVNSILCSINQTGYDQMVNQGTYLALVNEELCDRNSSKASDATNQSSGQDVAYESWIVNATRESNESDQIIEFWLELGTEGSGSDDPTAYVTEMKGKMVITEEASDDNPFGSFHFDFSGNDASGSPAFYGFLDASTDDDGVATVQMAMYTAGSYGDFSQSVYAILDQNSDSGRAFSTSNSDYYTQSAYTSFNAQYYHTRLTDTYNGSNTSCLDRDDYISSVHQYNLYDSSGDRVELESGFSIRYKEKYGYASYYGVWLPDDETISSGIEVQDEDGNDYTTLIGGGRLIKRTKTTGTLTDIKNENFMYWNYESGTYQQVKWNGSNFVVTGEQVCTDTGCVVESTSETTLSFYADEWVYIWKDGFGYVTIIVPESGLSNSTTTYSFLEQTVKPSDLSEEITLYCYNNCPKANIDKDDINNNDVYLGTSEYDLADDPYVYTFDPTTYKLYYNGHSVTTENTTDIDSTSSYSWGLNSGYLVTSELTHSWEMWEESTTYYWETGPNTWNKYVGLIDNSGNAVAFDAPLNCAYEHEEHGTYKLEYAGPGELWGIPYVLNENTNTGYEHWTALFAIEAGTAMECEGSTYYVKPMVVEEFMQVVNNTNCSDIPLPTNLEEPENLFETPDIGNTPDVSDEPAFIGGKPTS